MSDAKLVVRRAVTEFDSDPQWYVKPEGAGHMQHIAEFYLEEDAWEYAELRAANAALQERVKEYEAKWYESNRNLHDAWKRAESAEAALAVRDARIGALTRALTAAYEYFDLENQVDPTAGYEFDVAEMMREALLASGEVSE